MTISTSFHKRKADIRLHIALILLLSSIIVIAVSSVITLFFPRSPPYDKYATNHVSHRHLLKLVEGYNCSHPAIEQYPRPFFNQKQREEGGVAVFIFIAVYMFLGLAIVCDSYFVPSLEVICDKLQISADVGGATFMAAGSSAPELATAVIAVFISEDDIGVGTVVGSAVYNVTFVIAICGLFSGLVVYLHWYPLVRDCAVYTLSIVALILVINDGYITWYEAVILIVMYLLYILLMFFNRHIESWALSKATCCSHHLERTRTYHRIASESDSPKHDLPNGTVVEADKVTFDRSSEKISVGDTNNTDESSALLPKSDSEEEEESVWSFPSGIVSRILWIVSLPFTLVLFITTPDCRRKRWINWFVVTFIMSLVWLSVFSYIIVWMITVIGFTWGIPDTIMGLTFVAFGVSVPDAIASFIVVKEGEGDMAVSNAVGSNIFDILICLGVPWFLKTIIANSMVPVYSSGLVYSAITLLSTVVILVGVTHLFKWKMTRPYGAVLMVMYVIVTVLSALYEFDFFGIKHMPECPSVY